MKLTERQIDVLDRLVEGKSAKVIARELGIEPATAKVHQRAIHRKIGVHNRVQAAIWWDRRKREIEG